MARKAWPFPAHDQGGKTITLVRKGKRNASPREALDYLLCGLTALPLHFTGVDIKNISPGDLDLEVWPGSSTGSVNLGLGG